MRNVLVIAALFAAPAQAQDLEVMTLANALGSVLASEEPCGLAYDADAIRALIAEQVPPGALDFAAQLGGFTTAATYGIEAQTPSQRIAHCAAIELTAREYGFLK